MYLGDVLHVQTGWWVPPKLLPVLGSVPFDHRKVAGLWVGL